MKQKNTPLLIFILLITVGCFLRLIAFPNYPAGMHIDEAGMAYDAFCLSEYGTDRFLNVYPVYLVNYGSGQSALYAYLSALLLKLSIPDLWAVRLPAFFFGLLTLITGGLIARKAFGKNQGLLLPFFIAVCPYFIMSSRWGLDCNLFLGLSTFFLYLVMTALEKGNMRYFIISGIILGLNLYTYSLSWMVLPVFLVLLLGYCLYMKMLTIPKVLALGFPAFLLAIPLFLFLIVNFLELEPFTFLGLGIPRIPNFRSSHFSLSNLSDNWNYLWMLLSKDQYSFNSYDYFYTLYPISIPFVFYGIACALFHFFRSLKQKIWDIRSIPTLFFLACFFLGLIIEEPNIYRMNGIYFTLAYFTAWAFIDIASRLCRIVKMRFFLTGTIFVYSVYAICFINFYLTKADEVYPVHWYFNDHVNEVLESMEQHEQGQDVYIDSYNGSLYAYDLFRRRISPSEFCLENTPESSREKVANRYYYLPDTSEIREDALYVVFEYSGFGGWLDDMGFTRDQHGYYSLYYKE